MLLEPKQGWKKFKRCDQLLEFVTEYFFSANEIYLAVKRNQVIWEYYSFAENVCVWCSNELNARNQLQITFDLLSDQVKIKSLVIEMTQNSSQYFKELYILKRRLKRRFHLIEI